MSLEVPFRRQGQSLRPVRWGAVRKLSCTHAEGCAGLYARCQVQRASHTAMPALQQLRRANNESPFFAAALDPERGQSAVAAGQLLDSLRQDWDSMEAEFEMLSAGDEQNFDLRRLLETQTDLVAKVDRLTAALVRYASLTYGS